MIEIPGLIERRRSIRAFTDEPVDRRLIDMCIAAACRAPAPHHSRPWRFVHLSRSGLAALASALADAWRCDLETDGVDASEIDRLLDNSRRRIGGAPVGVLGCLGWDGLDRYPDTKRRDAEWGMARLSLGAAMQNLMLAATDVDIASCWIAAPIFAPAAAFEALDLDTDLYPEALVLLGHADPSYIPTSRPPIDLDSYRIVR